jgi:hypothetical protein
MPVVSLGREKPQDEPLSRLYPDVSLIVPVQLGPVVLSATIIPPSVTVPHRHVRRNPCPQPASRGRPSFPGPSQSRMRGPFRKKAKLEAEKNRPELLYMGIMRLHRAARYHCRRGGFRTC